MNGDLNVKNSLFAGWNEEEFAQTLNFFLSDPLFIPFHGITISMFDFLIMEKLHLFMNDGTRKVVDEKGEIISGYLQTFQHVEDEYHPQKFTPFMLSGYWIPEEEGDLFLIQEHFKSPFRRQRDEKQEILFLVHPKSETLFFPLTKLYNDTKIEVPALSLSSFRTLLVSLPNNGNYILAFAKLSLDEKINNVSRIISKKESGGSIAASIVFKKKLLSMNEKNITSLRIMEDVMSFVPKSKLIGHSVNHHPDGLGGMIVRQIPSFLLDPNATQRIVPVFSLLGVKNQPFFSQMILRSKRNHTQFLCEKILRPFSRVIVELLYSQNISIEAHGQNLLLVINNQSLQPIEGSEFMYRDMGGANVLLNENQLQSLGLPNNLVSNQYFYWDTFYVDSGLAIEYEFVKRVLFNLTKQLIKSITPIRDNEFREWRLEMAGQGYLLNWSECNRNEPFYENDRHVEVLEVNQYMCYGYVERKFKEVLIKELIISFPQHTQWFKSQLQRTYEVAYESDQFKELIQNTFLKIGTMCDTNQ